jgi:hypothetical protein
MWFRLTASLAAGASAVLALLAMSAPGARAQEAIATATSTPPPSPPVNTPPLRLSRKETFDDEGPPLVGPCGAVGEIKDGVPQKPDRKPHGEVFAGVGTHGYREVGGVVCVPVGDNGSVTLAIDAGRIRR